MLLNVELIRRRRRELGLSERAIAKHLRVTSPAVAGIEEGTNHEQLTLRTVVTLSRVLGVQPSDLIVTDRTSDLDPDRVRQVGQLLGAVGRPVPIDLVAELVGVTLDEVDALVEELDSRLRIAGFGVRNDGVEVALVGEPIVSPERMKDALRRHAAKCGLKLREVDLLRRIVDGDVNENSLGNADRVALGRLRNAGIVISDGLEIIDDSFTHAALASTTSKSASGP